jgi:hypothetical protein
MVYKSCFSNSDEHYLHYAGTFPLYNKKDIFNQNYLSYGKEHFNNKNIMNIGEK